MKIYNTLWERLMAQIGEPENEQACWPWEGNVTNAGYGSLQVRVPGKATPRKRYAHREIEHVLRDANEFDLDDDPFGPILVVERPRMHPDDETIEHMCANRRCGNPDHWIVVTRARNTQLMNERRNA